MSELELAPAAYEKYITAIHHFRGYVDKVRLEDDIEFLMSFVQDMVDELDSDPKKVESKK